MKNYILVFLLLIAVGVYGQNDRVNDHNNTNWIQTVNTVGIAKKWSLHLEYQWRRTNGLKNWQQSVLRLGTNYKISDDISVHAGYAWVETFGYGDYPIAPDGNFPEHRVYEQVTLKQAVTKLLITHRFRAEQRWLGKVKPATDREIERWSFLHRFRYQLRLQYLFWEKEAKQFYAIAANEIFIGAGKNVGVNIFDQDRIFGMLGFRLNKKFSVEGGYFNQLLQQGRRVNNSTIIQRNNGVLLGTFLNL